MVIMHSCPEPRCCGGLIRCSWGDVTMVLVTVFVPSVFFFLSDGADRMKDFFKNSFPNIIFMLLYMAMSRKEFSIFHKALRMIVLCVR